MQRIIFAIALWLSLTVGAFATESSMSFLDNRFRVDQTVERITFLVYRQDNSKPVTLVRLMVKNITLGVILRMFAGLKSPASISFQSKNQCQVLGKLLVK